LALSAVLLVAFVVVQILKPETATVPPRIFVQRSIFAGFYSTLCIGSQMMIFVYFLPIWFQAIKGISAIDSGIRLLPLVLAMVVSSVVTGVLTSHIGYYAPFLIIGVCLMVVGAGLLTTLQVDTGEAKWIGYQVLFGWGLGNSFQAPNLAAQTVMPTDDVPIGTSLMLFSQLLGGAVFISVGQNMLGTQLLERLKGVPGFNATFLQDEGATTITQLPDSIKPIVVSAYNEALREVFRVGLIMACLTIFGALAMEWRSVKKNTPEEKKDAEVAAEAAVEANEKDAEEARKTHE